MTQDEAKTIAAVIERLTDNARQRIEQAEQSARADAVTRAEADRVRIEVLSEELRKETEAHAKTADLLNKADSIVSGLREERNALRAEVAELKTQTLQTEIEERRFRPQGSDKVLTARLALQKAEDEVQRMESRKSAAMADLARYVSGTEKDLSTYREQVETAGKKAMSLELSGGKS